MIIPPGEKIIETKKCLLSGQEFFVTDKDLEFYDKVSPVFGGKKYSIPAPTLCPEERQRRRLAFRNERKLYKRKCDKTGKEIISVYNPEGPYKVYDQNEWWSDNWSPLNYGQVFDFEKSFFEQFSGLTKVTPYPNLLTINNINSPYAQYTGESKNIYMGADVWKCEDAFYSTTIKEVKNSLDLYEVEFAELCYACTLSKNLYACHWAVRSFNCQNCDFIFNCRQCQNCLFCWGLINQEYCIYNKPVSKEQYFKIRNNFFETKTGVQKALHEFSHITQRGTIRESWNINCEMSIGEDMKDCKNCFMSFDAVGCENCRYCSTAYQNKNCMDTTIFNPDSEWVIESVCGGVSLYSSGYNYSALNVSDGWYTWSCIHGANLFGCISLHSHEHHCILNKPYSVQEYETLCGRIIDHMRSTGEWGEFFPHELSPFGYNETVAQEYFPLSESEVKNMPRFSEWRFQEQRTSSPALPLKGEGGNGNNSPLLGGEGGGVRSMRGWNWYVEKVKKFEGTSYIPLPIREYAETLVGYETAKKNIDEVLAGIIKCEVSGKPFKIIRQELAFYIENSLPIPTKHPDQRHKERMELRNPRKLYERECSECHKEIITTYAPERSEKVVCEECYRKLVY